jgi:uncharacterized membrane protein YecN with MAPEG domain
MILMPVPVTSLYAALLALLVVALAFRVGVARRARRIGHGDGGSESLQRRIRAHGNAVEYIPLGLLLLLLLELAGYAAPTLHVLGGLLLVARVAHALGLSKSLGVTPGRFFGILATWLMLTLAAVLLLARSLGWNIPGI